MEIEPKFVALEDYFEGRNNIYKIPKYQRNYDWSREQWEVLWNDIVYSFNKAEVHFMGPFVLYKSGQESVGGRDRNVYEVVDGQQRSATFTVLLCVLRQYLVAYREGECASMFKEFDYEEDKIKKKITDKSQTLDGRLWLGEVAEERRIFRLNSKDDKQLRDKIFKLDCPLNLLQCKEAKSDPRIVKAHKYFSRKVHEDFLSESDGNRQLLELYEHISERMKFVRMVVTSEQGAAELFESLNFKSLELSLADLLKNKILMLCGSDEDVNKCNEKWDLLAGNIEASRFHLSDYIWIYWSAFYQVGDTATPKRKLYALLKDRLFSEADYSTALKNDKGKPKGEKVNPVEVMNFVAELEKYSMFFCRITPKNGEKNSTDDFVRISSVSDLDRILGEVNFLKYKICYPVFLFVKKHRESELKEIAQAVLIFLFRCITIGEKSVSTANHAMTSMMTKLRDEAPLDEVLKCLDFEIVTDEEMLDRISESRFESALISKYILLKIFFSEGDVNKKEFSAIIDKIDLEHVLPQNCGASIGWKDFVEEVKEMNLNLPEEEAVSVLDYVYSIGNQTLVSSSLNRKAKDKGFSEKKKEYKGSSGSKDKGTSISMTLEICGEKEWGVSEIEQRSKQIAKKIVEEFSF